MSNKFDSAMNNTAIFISTIVIGSLLVSTPALIYFFAIPHSHAEATSMNNDLKYKITGDPIGDESLTSEVKDIATSIETALVEQPNASVITTGSELNQKDVIYIYVGNDDSNTSISLNEENSNVKVNLSPGTKIKVSGNERKYLIHGFNSDAENFNSQESYLEYSSDSREIQTQAKTKDW